MAVTSGWSWKNIARGINTNVYAGITRTRNNWSLNRYRISDDTYSSELGTLATSLSAANGGVTETVNAPSVNAVTFTGGTPAVYNKLVVSGCTGGSAVVNGTYTRTTDFGGNPRWTQSGASTYSEGFIYYYLGAWRIG